MKFPPSLKPGIWGAVIGAAAISVLGFSSFGWTLGSTAEQELVRGVGREGVATPESENSVRLLGAFRGVSEGLVNSATQSGGIDWARLREARF